jgi:hypothetical protein
MAIFPEACPWSLERVLGADFLPEAGGTWSRGIANFPREQPKHAPLEQSSLWTDQAHIPVDADLRPERLRDVLQPLQRFLGHLTLCQQWPTALGNGASIAHIDGVEPDLF